MTKFTDTRESGFETLIVKQLVEHNGDHGHIKLEFQSKKHAGAAQIVREGCR